MWMTVPSWPSGFRSSSCSRSGSTAELLFHGGGPVWRPGMLAHGMFVELVVAADEEPPLESVTPSTTPTITSTATAPPAIHQRRSTVRTTGAPFERTGGAGLRVGGGPRPCFRRVDCFAISAAQGSSAGFAASAPGTRRQPEPLDSRIRRIWLFRGPGAPSDLPSTVSRLNGDRRTHRRRVRVGRGCAPAVAAPPGRARRAPRAGGARALVAECRRRPPAAGGRRDDGPPALRARHEGRPTARDGGTDDDADPRAARRGDEGDGGDDRPCEGARPARAGAAAAEGTRRIRRAPAREPAARPAAARRLRAAVLVL